MLVSKTTWLVVMGLSFLNPNSCNSPRVSTTDLVQPPLREIKPVRYSHSFIKIGPRTLLHHRTSSHKGRFTQQDTTLNNDRLMGQESRVLDNLNHKYNEETRKHPTNGKHSSSQREMKLKHKPGSKLRRSLRNRISKKLANRGEDASSLITCTNPKLTGSLKTPTQKHRVDIRREVKTISVGSEHTTSPKNRTKGLYYIYNQPDKTPTGNSKSFNERVKKLNNEQNKKKTNKKPIKLISNRNNPSTINKTKTGNSPINRVRKVSAKPSGGKSSQRTITNKNKIETTAKGEPKLFHKTSKEGGGCGNSSVMRRILNAKENISPSKVVHMDAGQLQIHGRSKINGGRLNKIVKKPKTVDFETSKESDKTRNIKEGNYNQISLVHAFHGNDHNNFRRKHNNKHDSINKLDSQSYPNLLLNLFFTIFKRLIALSPEQLVTGNKKRIRYSMFHVQSPRITSRPKTKKQPPIFLCGQIGVIGVTAAPLVARAFKRESVTVSFLHLRHAGRTKRGYLIEFARD
ncbi:unnamed protein product [Timema podura]|uniref:Uncharacterized protein n=1 Tax=Timema podura TaxID=61482 RepID=A0ABN7NNR4_TIMPD|nr:unnamed protein product [Timema podura]